MKINKKILMILIILIFIIVVLICVGLLKNLSKKNNENESADDYELKIETNIKKVTNANDFYTVVTCVRKYLSSAKDKNPNELVQLLSEQYKKDNNINEKNVLEKIKTYNSTNVFEPKKMYGKDLSVTQRRFYVYGTIKEDLYLISTEPKDYYIVVDLDYETDTFAVSFDEKVDEKMIK